MGTRGLNIVRFRGRYYIQYNLYDSYFDSLGVGIVRSIPQDPEEYQKWLESMRAQYAAKERALEEGLYEMREGSTPDYSLIDDIVRPPSELPRLEDYYAEYFYIMNLDREILTMNFSIHWHLGNIPRQDDLWLRAIADSIYPKKPTISPDLCPEEHMACPALELRKPNRTVDYPSLFVTPKKPIITETRKAFLTYVLAKTLLEYKNAIIWFGREWSPDSFPFRELAFALVSIASGRSRFHSFAARSCSPRCRYWQECRSRHLPESCGWLDERWAGDSAPLLEFGSMSHRQGDPPGVSPMEPMYWLEDVLVSLTLVVDGEAITKAVTWGIEQGRTSFQVVVLSLFKVAFVEVFFDSDHPVLKISDAVKLSPLRAEYCVSTHPRERPELKSDRKIQRQHDEILMQPACTETVDSLRDYFSGLVALVEFFDVAAKRRATSKSPVTRPPIDSLDIAASPSAASGSRATLPTELHDRIIDFVDYDTWRICSVVSRKFRSYCLRKFRLDDKTSIVAGPFVEKVVNRGRNNGPRLSFDFEDTQTGKITRLMQARNNGRRREHNWMPVVGSNRKAFMLDMVVQFEPVPTAEGADNKQIHKGNRPIAADSESRQAEFSHAHTA